MNNINANELRGLHLALPTLAEQQEVVRRVRTLLRCADALEHRLNHALTVVGRLTPATLAKAFRGELVPQDPSDEPADQLLARIRAERAAATTQTPTRKPGRPAKAKTQKDNVTP